MSERDIIEEKIKASLDQLRPHLQYDGGDIRLLEISPDFDVRVELMGACSNCSISATTKAGVERAIMAAVPQVRTVETISVPAL